MEAYLWAVSLAAFCLAMISVVIAWSAYELVNQPAAGQARTKRGRFRKV